jgi:hypothetical protein
MNRVKWVGSCAAVVLVISALPTNARGEATDKSQKNKTSHQAAPTCQCIGQENSSTIGLVHAALDGRMKDTGLDFTETPLEQVVNSLHDEYGIPILLDLASLKGAGLNPEVPITVNLHNISLGSALRLMLHQHQLAYVIRDDVLLITTPEDAERHLVTCVYDIRDLVTGENYPDEVEALVQAVTSCVASESWAENGGGQAEIRPLKPGVLVISQTQSVQDEIRELLDAVRKIREHPVARDEPIGAK